MNDIYILVDTNTAKTNCENKKIGVLHANLQNKLIFEMTEKINGSAWLEYEIDGVKNYAVMEETEKGYQIDIKSCLLISDYVEVDLKITETENADGIPIFISTKEKLEVYSSINAIEEEPEYYPDWKTIADSKIAEMNQLKEDVNEAITKTNNLNIDVSKSGKTATITLTKKDNTTKTVTLSDGTNLMFNWNGTKLGIKTDDEQEYTYVDLIGPQGIQGETGATPNLTIGTVITGNASSATITGTSENPVLNLVLEKGDTGETGATGNGIASIVKTGTSGNIDIYTITYTNGNTSTFTVTNSTVTNQEFEDLKEKHEELVNTLPRVAGTGTSVTLDNTVQHKMNIKLNPSDLSQTITTGKNLLDTTTYQFGYIGSDGAYHTDSSNKNVNFTQYITVSPNTQYTFSCNKVLNNMAVSEYDENFIQRTYIQNTDSITLTTTNNTTRLRLQFNYDGSSAITSAIINNLKLMLENDSTRTDYEPYSNLIPSPSHSYSQEIHVIKGNNVIQITGKNFFNDGIIPQYTYRSNYEITTTGITISNTDASGRFIAYTLLNMKGYEGKKVRLKATWTTTGKGRINIITTAGGNTSGTSRAYTETSGETISYTIPNTIDEAQPYLGIRLYATTTSVLASTTYSNVILTIGNEDMTYEPYQSRIFPLNLVTFEYCKIGNYLDDFILATGKNLFDKSNANILNASISSSTSMSSSSNGRSLYIPIQGGKTYTIIKRKSERFRVGTTALTPVANSNIIDHFDNDTGTKTTIKTSHESNYLVVYFFLNGTDTLTEQEILDSIMINEGSIILPYEPYGNGIWYIKKSIGKVTLNGTETWDTTDSGLSTQMFRVRLPYNHIDRSSSTPMYSNYYLFCRRGDNPWNVNNSISYDSGNQIRIKDDSASDLTIYKAWLENNNVPVYYPLETPTYTELTDTTLIAQLNNLYTYIISYLRQTNITQTNADLPFDINANALYDLNNLISRVATLETEV